MPSANIYIYILGQGEDALEKSMSKYEGHTEHITS